MVGMDHFKIIWNLLAALTVAGALHAARFHLRWDSAIGRPFYTVGLAVLLVLVLESFVVWMREMLGAEWRLQTVAADIALVSASPALACFFVLFYIHLQECLLRTDGLTGACSRMYFECRLSGMLEQNSAENFGIIYLDVDNFKDINDRLGHLAGDEALKTLVFVIKNILRRTDTVSRLGGDEFGILLHVDSQAALETVVRKIEQALGEYNRASGQPYEIACSMGSKLFRKSSALSVEAVLSQVDRLMYDCKKEKRDVYQEL